LRQVLPKVHFLRSNLFGSAKYRNGQRNAADQSQNELRDYFVFQKYGKALQIQPLKNHGTSAMA
jgi:hypothetical protein